MNRDFKEEYFVPFNGFYGKSHCRQVVLHLYDGKCATCDRAIDGESFHVAHIIPRSHPDMMRRYFSVLDVDNLLNLKLSCPRCNHGESNFVLDGLPLLGAFNHSAKVISSRLESVLAKLQATVKRIEMSGADSKICTDILYIDVNEVSSFASDWHGAVVVARPGLGARVREALLRTLGEEAADMAVYWAVEEAIGNFQDYLEIDGNNYSIRSTGKRTWLVEATAHLRSESHDVRPLAHTRKAIGLIDGVYLDPEELNTRGLLIPLRTQTQYWFRKIFATIVWTQRKLDTSSRRQYCALGEREWRSLCDCFEKLSLIESGIGKVGRRLKVPDIVAHFRLCDDELHFGAEDLKIPEEVRGMCRAHATDSIWGDGALIRKSKLKPWLARAFFLAEQAAQQVTGPHLIRIGDERTPYQWVPPLPKLVGKTREEIRLEEASLSIGQGRRRKSQQSI